MAYIPSANQSNFTPIEPLDKPSYVHGADTRKNYIPLAFQVTSPYDVNKVLLPHALIAHVNPSSFSETFSKKVERAPTRGGYVEWHWGDDLSEVSVEQSTGAFINLRTGLSSLLRQRTIAWDRYRDLYDLFRNNGSVYNPEGAIVLQGWVLLMFDRGTYIGTFRTFSVEETDDSPFVFKLSWTFKVEKIIHQIPQNSKALPFRTAEFQSMNRSQSGALNPTPASVGTPVAPPGGSPPVPGTHGDVIDLDQPTGTQVFAGSLVTRN